MDETDAGHSGRKGAQKETVKVESLPHPVIHKEDVKTATVLVSGCR